MTSLNETGTITGTKDKDYDLLWYIESCLENALRLETYRQDAEQAGDAELVELFSKAQADSRKGAELGKSLLASRLTSTMGTSSDMGNMGTGSMGTTGDMGTGSMGTGSMGTGSMGTGSMGTAGGSMGTTGTAAGTTGTTGRGEPGDQPPTDVMGAH